MSTKQPPKNDSVDKGKEIIPSSIVKGKGKWKIVDDIDLDEEIVIPNWDQSNLSANKMDILGEFWKKSAKQ